MLIKNQVINPRLSTLMKIQNQKKKKHKKKNIKKNMKIKKSKNLGRKVFPSLSIKTDTYFYIRKYIYIYLTWKKKKRKEEEEE